MMNVSFNDEEIDILNGKDIEKQKELIKVKVDDFKGPNIEDFFWICINAKKNENKNKKKALTVYKRPKDDIDDEKKMDKDNEQKTQSLSMLIDFKLAKTTKDGYKMSTGHGMCPKGDVWFKKDKGVCMECESEENVMKCDDCNLRDKVRCVLCKNCRIMNLNKLEYESKMDNIKRKVIRAELCGKPSLSLDILCGLPRVSALDKLMKDIMGLEAFDRMNYSLFLVDMDNLKALNSVLSHQGADEVIKNVGLTLKNWCVKVNNGKVKKLDKGFCFRQGGDEFAIIVRSEEKPAYDTNFSDFFLGWKKEINNLVNRSFMDKYKANDKDLKEGIKTLKERKKKKIETALNGIKIDEKIKTNIFDAVNNMDITFDIKKIGISVGLFIPKYHTKDTDWIRCAEIAQDAAKDIKGKNSISIYYERINGVIPQNKTESCLEKGCGNAMQCK